MVSLWKNNLFFLKDIISKEDKEKIHIICKTSKESIGGDPLVEIASIYCAYLKYYKKLPLNIKIYSELFGIDNSYLTKKSQWYYYLFYNKPKENWIQNGTN